MKTLLRSLLVLCWLYTSASAQWTPNYTFSNSQWIWQPFPVNENVVWGEIDYNSGEGGFFRTTDGGATWYNDTLPDVDATIHLHARNATTA